MLIVSKICYCISVNVLEFIVKKRHCHERPRSRGDEAEEVGEVLTNQNRACLGTHQLHCRLAAMGGGGQSPAPVVGDKTPVSPPVTVTSAVENMEVDMEPVVPVVKRNRTTSSANYESSPTQILTRY